MMNATLLSILKFHYYTVKKNKSLEKNVIFFNSTEDNTK